MKLIFAILILLGCLPATAQVAFEPITFEEALNKAERDGKYLMVVLDSKDCDHCNEVADKSFENKNLGNTLSKKFISIRPKVEDDTWNTLGQYYDAPNGMITLFFSGNGVLLHRFNGTSTMAKQYADAAETAIEKESEILNLKSLEEAYKLEKNNPVVLQALLSKRKELWLSTDDLLEEYVKLLSRDSLKSLHQLQFIASLAPVLGSDANNKLRADQDLFNQAWYRMDLPTRIRINNQIIYKTRQIAIKKRDRTMANNVAQFAMNTNSNPVARQRAHMLNLMEYHKGVNDTASYLPVAASYYNRFYMTISVDSIVKKDSLEKQRLLGTAKVDTIKRSGSSVTRSTTTVTFRPSTQLFMKELNKAAWSFYSMTRKPEYISQALQWSARGLEFYRSPEILDTHARLLYIAGKKEEAIQFENEAIALHKQRGFDPKEYEKVLADMQTGTLK